MIAPVLALIPGLVLLGVTFHAEAFAAVGVWLASTAYNHCFLVLPIAGFLAWERRGRLATAKVRPAPLIALLLAIPFGLAWFAAARLGIMEGRQLAAMGFVQLLVIGCLGTGFWRAFAAPLLYLFFLVPFGAFITPALQTFTAHFMTAGLTMCGVPNFSDGNRIDIPEGSFYVATACAGLRFLVASVAFGVLYALTLYRTAGRRIAFIAVSLVVPVIANGFRALGIALLGHYLGSAKAAATDHIVYGWIFFSIVILLLTALGLPFRQDLDLPRPQGRVRIGRGGSLAAGIAVGCAAALFPLVSTAIDHIGTAPSLAGMVLFVPGPCAPTAPPPDPRFARADRQAFACDGVPVVARLITFPPRATPASAIHATDSLFPVADDEQVTHHAMAAADGSGYWALTTASAPPRAMARMLWLDGAPARGGLAARINQAWRVLAGHPGPPVLAVVIAEGGRAPEALRLFLAAQRDLSTQAGELSAGTPPPARFSLATPRPH